MWYECIPPFAIITGLLYLPQITAWYFNKAVLGNHFRRELLTPYDSRMFLRDTRIDGAPWLVRGLENIPDEP